MKLIELLPYTNKKIFRFGGSILVLMFVFLFSVSTVVAQEQVQVNEIQGRLEPGRLVVYLIPDLQAGQTIYVYLEATSGNLDPFVGFIRTNQDTQTLLENYRNDVLDSIDNDDDPLISIRAIRDKYLLAWDDDSGNGYSAAFKYTIREDGNYHLVISAALSSLKINTFGDYRLLVGIDAPQVLTGEAKITENQIVVLDESATPKRVSVQETIASFTTHETRHTYQLNNMEEGDTLYVFVESISGNLIPSMVLLDFGEKPVRSSNISGTQTIANMEYTFSENVNNYSLMIEACCGNWLTSGTYRLLIGLNEPKISSGRVAEIGEPVIKQPIEVSVGIKLQQITEVNQKAENFGAVVSMQMEWVDPVQGFSPDSCDCKMKVYTGSGVDDFIEESNSRFPEFTISNQQDNRWTQNSVVVQLPDGHMTYFERFTTQFQAPHFNFRKFPLDQQHFFIHVDSLYPEEYYIFRNLKGFTEVGTQLGEEEWTITGYDTSVTSQVSNTQSLTTRYSFRFRAKRTLDYYITRIFIPIFLILTISWITFFLHDFGKRIDVTSANLLLFIALNFTVSNDLPRLGYLTFLDSILLATFITSVVVVLYNVIMRRMEIMGKDELAHKLDHIAIWIYPISYAFAFLIVYNVYIGVSF